MQTLIQLAQNAAELQIPLPEFEIEDQPNSDYRAIHIDLKHHLDKMEYMYQVLDRMAYYKLNAATVVRICSSVPDFDLIQNYRRLATRNDYSLQVFERINDLTGYTAKLLVASLLMM